MMVDMNRLFDLPPKYVPIIIPILNSFSNGTSKYDEFQFRNRMKPYILISILSYTVIFVFGLYMNIRLIRWITRFRTFLSSSHAFLFSLLLGNSINDLFIKDVIVLPISFMILTAVHWTLGESSCRLFPLLQDSCFHVTSLTFFCAFHQRYKQISNANFNSITQDVQYPEPPSCHPFLVIVVCWFIAIVGVIPHTVFITYIDLGFYLGAPFKGTGVCVVNLEDNIAEYLRFLFALFYLIPLVLSISYHFKAVDILEKWKKSSIENRGRGVAIVHRGSVVENVFHPPNGQGNSSISGTSLHSNSEQNFGAQRFSYSSVEHHVGGTRGGSFSTTITNAPSGHQHNMNSRRSRTLSLASVPPDERRMSGTGTGDEYSSPTSSLSLEEETQKMLLRIFSIHSILLLPLNVLRFTKHLMPEPAHLAIVFDMIFVVFVGVQFLTTVIIPWYVLRVCPVYVDNSPEMTPIGGENLQLFRMNLLRTPDSVN